MTKSIPLYLLATLGTLLLVVSCRPSSPLKDPKISLTATLNKALDVKISLEEIIKQNNLRGGEYSFTLIDEMIDTEEIRKAVAGYENEMNMKLSSLQIVSEIALETKKNFNNIDLSFISEIALWGGTPFKELIAGELRKRGENSLFLKIKSVDLTPYLKEKKVPIKVVANFDLNKVEELIKKVNKKEIECTLHLMLQTTVDGE